MDSYDAPHAGVSPPSAGSGELRVRVAPFPGRRYVPRPWIARLGTRHRLWLGLFWPPAQRCDVAHPRLAAGAAAKPAPSARQPPGQPARTAANQSVQRQTLQHTPSSMAPQPASLPSKARHGQPGFQSASNPGVGLAHPAQIGLACGRGAEQTHLSFPSHVPSRPGCTPLVVEAGSSCFRPARLFHRAAARGAGRRTARPGSAHRVCLCRDEGRATALSGSLAEPGCGRCLWYPKQAARLWCKVPG